MYAFVLAVHIIVCLLLVVIILLQRGRGGGLVESLAGAESLFGTKTSSFLVKSTTVLAVLFFITSTSLALLSKQRGSSILQRKALLRKRPAASGQIKTPSSTPAQSEAQKPAS